ncbi:pyruvate dehydrogenase E2 component (dihydrolipoamide acetyltransferase) [Actinomadura pelletieri DSM 43383]|uniref:Dihydrolipoamide acetyltransferase component of pyruvate dehydrogenase complex n=1 Tax=Actinomadura pelletieri DSM 43383 TaxID=1120940 RepID=A0A495QGB5_9ACTN|nr:dihydrolipoamide acetyltransferase family protein [Actinomadura pelletieri]RKS70868.1 pyruvate dehydrogenase E2 component (dihydrolipoamide acetyltransferase) [Actinomadura pelletieri DSM 43383]
MSESIFRLPDLGEGLTEAEIVEWKVSVGDVVTVDQSVVEVETAKAAVEVPVPIAGTVTRLYGEAGTVVNVGAPLIAVTAPKPAGTEAAERYREEERAGSGNVLVGYGTSTTRRSRRAATRLSRSPHPETPRPETPHSETSRPEASRSGSTRTEIPRAETPRVETSRAGTARVISPVVRRLAREHGVDLAALVPSGPGGVILRKDVEAAIERAREEAAAATTSPGEGADVVRIPLRGVRRTTADRVTRSRREIPDATTWVDADATRLLKLRRNIQRTDPDAAVGMLALFARICVAGLRRFPELNAHVDVERHEIVQVPQVNLGFAAQTDRGLMVPIVRDAHRLTLAELAAELKRLTGAARDGRLSPDDLTGGTFTLNNYGVFGVDGSTPIINHPEAAMLGVGRIADRPWTHKGKVRSRKITQLSLTFDHRVCDGAVAGGFLRFVADCVERPETLVTHL